MDRVEEEPQVKCGAKRAKLEVSSAREGSHTVSGLAALLCLCFMTHMMRNRVVIPTLAGESWHALAEFMHQASSSLRWWPQVDRVEEEPLAKLGAKRAKLGVSGAREGHTWSLVHFS